MTLFMIMYPQFREEEIEAQREGTKWFYQLPNDFTNQMIFVLVINLVNFFWVPLIYFILFLAPL